MLGYFKILIFKFKSQASNSTFGKSLQDWTTESDPLLYTSFLSDFYGKNCPAGRHETDFLIHSCRLEQQKMVDVIKMINMDHKLWSIIMNLFF